MPGTETTAHANLKKLAVLWARGQGYAICGVEIRLPHSNYRADVAAYRTETRRLPLSGEGNGPVRLVRQPVVGTTAVFECKQARADFLKDSHSREPTLQRLKVLEARRLKLEELLRVHLPSLRKGDSLFQEYEVTDLTRYEHKTYASVIREIAVLQGRLYGKTKFERLARYRCANLCYLVVEEGVLRPHEFPLHWGLLVRRGETLTEARQPTWQEVSEPTRLELLQRIGMAGARRLEKEWGILPVGREA
jgi:hypothetical protein